MPSDGFTFDELREEYDWMSDFMSRMAERIRDNADVHSLAGYVAKLESENAKLRELVKDIDEVADPYLWEFIGRRMRELGIEVDE